MQQQKPKVVIERAWWRAGKHYAPQANETTHGRGDTRLINTQGYRCCLGFAANQLANISDDQLLSKPMPEDVGLLIPFLTKENTEGFKLTEDGCILQNHKKIINTQLSDDASVINDSHNMPLKEKEEFLIELFARHGIELEFTGEYTKG